MGLLIKRAGADEYGRWLKVLLAGDPGCGKTRMSSTFPNPIYASAEAGLMSVTDRAPAFMEINSTNDLNLLRLALMQPTPSASINAHVETVILDTLDEIQRMFVRERLHETKQESMKIQDYGWLGDQMRGLVRGFRNLPMHVVFCIHTKTDSDNETGKVSVKPQLQGAIADEIAAYVDLAVLLKTQQTTKIVDGVSKRVDIRLMQTSADANHSWVKDRSGKLPHPDMEVNLDDDFARIHELIWPKGQTITASSVISEMPSAPVPEPVVLPDPPQKSEKATKKSSPVAERKPKAPADAPETVAEPVAQVVEEPPAAVSPPPVSTDIETPELVVSSASSPKAPPAAEVPKPTPVAQKVEANAPPFVANGANGNGANGTSHEPVVVADVCKECGVAVDEDQRDLGLIRYREILCRTHFVAKKAAAVK